MDWPGLTVDGVMPLPANMDTRDMINLITGCISFIGNIIQTNQHASIRIIELKLQYFHTQQ